VSEIIPGIRESDPVLLETYGRVSSTGKSERFEIHLEALKMWFSVSVYSPQRGYFVAVFDVISERKKMEEELKAHASTLEQKVEERTAELERVNLEVRKLLETKTQFINQLSHDLRTPLTPLTTLTPLLTPYMTDEVSKNRMDIINRNIGYMRDLVVRTLNLAKLDSGTIEFKFEPVDLKRLVSQIIADEQAQLDASGISTFVDIPDEFVVLADELRLKEVIDNILGNAVKFVSAGGKITVSARHLEDEVEVAFSDTGIGLNKDQLELIFTEFYKADTSRHSLSAGLGLAICKRIIESHGGRIWAESEGPGKGTTVRFTLPLRPQ
jgi:signal transduction histidine kinase